VSGAKHRTKGNRIEREIVDRHLALGVKSERYPLSGASRFRGSGHDVDVYCFGGDDAPIVGEVKGRKNGSGFMLLENWLSSYDVLFLRRNNADPLVVLPWRVWERILKELGGKNGTTGYTRTTSSRAPKSA
jgi:Holliday junction resolvase